MCCQYTQLHAGNENSLPNPHHIHTIHFYHFRLIGIFGTNTGYTPFLLTCILYLIHLIFSIGVGFRVGFFLRRGYNQLIRNTLADFCRLTYFPDFLAIHTRVLFDITVADFLLYRDCFQLIKRSPNS
jgi:hypothetical protein